MALIQDATKPQNFDLLPNLSELPFAHLQKKMVVFTSLKFLRFRGSGISCVVLQVHAAHLLPLDLLSRHPCTQGACSTVLIATNQH